ncbi:FeoC-like transcriptional regulator [Edwardsiella ictaluri]|nr:FeoC-like transcriptional regulator [Edwardsiella ictaluri]EKS7762888.1 ferrous iron transporter C [Edwardsiella ictaluri]EKS7769800.1 ferrous iron transporter C [Edwardsiella ictaluri]EKS7772853.1 ferrous iron transporter C [Edwardsiella ictaluri]EKS7776399.1 ferrous iron transporter C [Edwardsiella ictaluri]EKS7786527.1 ferrous iron transporter C [Edwardsiella ictaluri]
MTTLLQVRDTVALHGRIELQRLCREVGGTPALVRAMLERLELMGCVEKVDDMDSGCLSGSCKGCPEAQKKCETVVYRIRTLH